MSMPKAYDPQTGYKYQILVMTPYSREYEHCDYAADRKERDYLIGEYRLAYGPGFSYKAITLPVKYWPSSQPGFVLNLSKGQPLEASTHEIYRQIEREDDSV